MTFHFIAISSKQTVMLHLQLKLKSIIISCIIITFILPVNIINA